MMRFLTLLIASLLFTGISAKAQAARDKAQPEYYGTWASPDCGNYSQALVFTEHYLLESTEAFSKFSHAEEVARKKDYTVARFEGETRPVLRSEDGLLLIGTPEKAPPEWPAHWDDLVLAGHSEYSHCGLTPSVIPIPLVRAMAQIEALRSACTTELTAACGKLLFKIADSNNNGHLSLSEFRKAGALLGTFTPLVAGEPVDTALLEQAYLRGAVDGKALFESVLPLRDKNKSGDLDRKEMENFIADAKAHEATQDMLTELAKLFPAFK